MNQMQKRYLIKQVGQITERKERAIDKSEAPKAPHLKEYLRDHAQEGIHIPFGFLMDNVRGEYESENDTIVSRQWAGGEHVRGPRPLHISGIEGFVPGYYAAAKAAAKLVVDFEKAKSARIAKLNAAADKLVSDLMFGDDPVPQALEKFAAMEF